MVKSRHPDIFAALSDGTRLAMVTHLARGDATVGELGAPFSMSTPAVLKHISVLERAGVIRTRKQGRVRVCRLNPKALASATSWLEERQKIWETRLDMLGALIEGEDR